MIKRYVDAGGSLLVLLSEGGESRSQTNINYLLEQYGISVNSGQLHSHMPHAFSYIIIIIIIIITEEKD